MLYNWTNKFPVLARVRFGLQSGGESVTTAVTIRVVILHITFSNVLKKKIQIYRRDFRL